MMDAPERIEILELWRIEPATLLTCEIVNTRMYLIAEVGPPPGLAAIEQPDGWPDGYEWRHLDAERQELNRWPATQKW